MDSRKRKQRAQKNKNNAYVALTGKTVWVPAHALPGGTQEDNTLLRGRIKVGGYVVLCVQTCARTHVLRHELQRTSVLKASSARLCVRHWCCAPLACIC